MFAYVRIIDLISKTLKKPLMAIIEKDDEGYIAHTVDLPLYGFGGTMMEAIDNLKYEIETTYDELKQRDNLSEEWAKYKKFLSEIIEGGVEN